MPEPPDEFEREVREELDDMAGEAAPSPTAPPDVLRSARSRVARNSAALVVALAMVTGGVAAGFQLAGRDRGGPIPIAPSETPPSGNPTCDASHQQGAGPCPGGSTAPETSTPTTPATTAPEPTASSSEVGPPGGTGPGPMPLMLFIDGLIYRYTTGASGLSGEVAAVTPEVASLQPPVATPYGIVFLERNESHGTDLWLLGTDPPSDRLLIATGVDGFAVSGDGTRVAYAFLSLPGRNRATLNERSLVNGASVTSAPIDTYVSVGGYVGDDVLLTMGDGAAVTAATWHPGNATIDPLPGYSIAQASDPASGWAVLEHGDGGCWSIVNLVRHGAPERDLNRCHIRGVSFDGTGEIVAGIEGFLSNDTDRVLLLAGTTSSLGGSDHIRGAYQTWWHGKDQGAETVYVLAEPTPGHYAVTRCRVSETLCSGGPVWSGSGDGRDGGAWIVEERGLSG